MVFLTCLMKILESQNTFIFFASKSTSFISPSRRHSYSIVLFVHWKSSLQSINFLFLVGSFSIQPTNLPSKYFDPSKNKVHILGSLFSLCMNSRFSLFFELVWLMKLEKISNLSLNTMLLCETSFPILSSMLQ